MATKNIRALAKTAAKNSQQQQMILSHLLVEIRERNLAATWGYSSWEEYVEVELGIGLTESYELMSIARWVQRIHLTKVQEETVHGLGRSRAYLLSRSTATKESLSEYVKMARTHTVTDLRNLIYTKELGGPKTVSFWLMLGEQRQVSAALTKAADLLPNGKESRLGEQLVVICDSFLSSN